MNVQVTKPTIHMTRQEYQTIRKFINILEDPCFKGYDYEQLVDDFPIFEMRELQRMEASIYIIEIDEIKN